eukprot:757458-Hanusia_phi.AAC.3
MHQTVRDRKHVSERREAGIRGVGRVHQVYWSGRLRGGNPRREDRRTEIGREEGSRERTQSRKVYSLCEVVEIDVGDAEEVVDVHGAKARHGCTQARGET